jgi:hypothetical protein
MSSKGAPLSAVFPFQVVLVDRTSTDTALGALLGVGDDARVYASKAPEETPLPYVVVAQSTESGAGLTLDKHSNRIGVTVDVWSDLLRYGNGQGLAIYGHLKRLFQGAQLALDGHDVVTCVVDLVIELPDEDGKTHHAQVLIQPVTQQRRTA